MSVWASCFGLETVSLRYFNVFGPRQDPGSQYSGVLSLFITAVLERRTPTIFGDGGTSRDFTYVDDVVGLNIRAADAPSSVSGKVFNAGNGGRITLNQAWDLLQKIEGVSIPANYGPERAGDVRDSRRPDTTAAVRELGHTPCSGALNFPDGLRPDARVVSESPLPDVSDSVQSHCGKCPAAPGCELPFAPLIAIFTGRHACPALSGSFQESR